jgi:hypothetical protein
MWGNHGVAVPWTITRDVLRLGGFGVFLSRIQRAKGVFLQTILADEFFAINC